MVLRKAGYIILATLLIISTTGLAVSRHYCGPDLISVSLFDEPEPCCNTEGCCHNDNDYLQVDEDFIVATAQNIPAFSNSVDFQFPNNNISLNNQARDIFSGFPNHEHPPPPLLKEVLPRIQSFLL